MFRVVLVACAMFTAACGTAAGSTNDADTTSTADANREASAAGEQATSAGAPVPPAPSTPAGPADAATAAFDEILAMLPAGGFTSDDIATFTGVADARHAWLISDLLRFISSGAEAETLLDSFETLTGVDAREDAALIASSSDSSPWNRVTNLLIAWDTPAPPDYQRLKGELFTLVEPGWTPFFADTEATIDWRWLSWGGVFIDDRPVGDRDPCDGRGCIPALDDPALVSGSAGDWYPDDAIVFGVTEGDESVAFPKNVMQVHEMVNITIGGRRFGIPYCTLCGSAQAFYTDESGGAEQFVLRTSGLLSRSNKVMYDLQSSSVFDTFTGEAVSGPLREAGVVLEQTSVTVSTWAEWREAHPNTAIVAEDGGIGRAYADDPLQGRDDDGPIFPTGDVDPRLDAQTPVLGVILADGTAIAFDAATAKEALDRGDNVGLRGVSLRLDGSGLAASSGDDDIAAHEAFWFAWSQFHPDTLLWPDDM